MREADLNLVGLARKLGLAHPSVRAWIEGAARPTDDNMRGLARVFGTSVLEVYQAAGVIPAGMDLPELKARVLELALEMDEPWKLRSLEALLLSLRDERQTPE
jgi:transcriptional regulator with XRE-family HTH domain